MKMSERRINLKRQEGGAWVKNIPDWDGLQLKVRGAGNKDWDRMQSRLINAIPRKRRLSGVLEPEDRDRINATLLRDTALLDWRGLEDDDGKPLPYSKEVAGKYLTAPEFAPFRDAVMWAANVVAQLDAADIEDDVGN